MTSDFPWRFAVGAATGFIIGGALGFAAAGQHSTTPARSRTDGNEASDSALSATATWESSGHARTQSPVRASYDAGVPDGGHSMPGDAQRAAQAHQLMNRLSYKIRSAEFTRYAGEGALEANANELAPYLEGWLDAMVTGSPELVEDFGAELAHFLCEETPSDLETLLSLRAAVSIGSTAPRAIAPGIDCVFRRRRGREDVVLWEALDAWRQTGAASTDEIELIRQTADDERTESRLVSEEAQHLLRMEKNSHSVR